MSRTMKVLRAVALLVAVTFVGAVWLEEAMARGGWGGGGRGGGGGGGGRGGWGRGPSLGGGRGGGGFGKRADGITDRGDVAKDLEERRAQDEKEARITEARKSGAETAFDDMQNGILVKEREKAAADRRDDWRKLANPG